MDIKTVNTIIYCKKWKETVEFYKTKLQLEVTASFEWFIEFKLNDTSRLSIANEERTSINSSCGKGLTITMRVDNIQDTHSLLEKTGAKPTPIKDHSWGAKVIYIYDPEGNRLEFWSQNI
ncbi:MAG: VOC family protein [Desulfobacterales bacterium]|nr:VOC family protein [Desulfobacterales bacterium]